MPKRAYGDVAHDGHVTQWHRWQDKPNMRYMPAYWQAPSSIFTGLDVPSYCCTDMASLIETVTRNELFTFCNDLLSQDDFDYADELLGNNSSIPYLTKSGKVPALRLSAKRKSGFLIPASSWLYPGQPDTTLLNEVNWIFGLFGFQSVTIPSLSEKVLRATLPEILHLSRSSIGVRSTISEHGTQARIDKAEVRFYEEANAYDKNKAYLFHSRCVPSPYMAPLYLYRPTLSELDRFPTYFVQCDFVVCPTVVAPLLIDGKNPQCMGEVLTRYLWREQLEDILDAGYKLVTIHGGYAWREMSGFMEMWGEILWEKYLIAKAHSDYAGLVVKRMMHGVPGRMLRDPYRYVLAPAKDAQEGDVPIQLHWRREGDKIFSDWVAHREYDRESTALTPIGDYIKMKMAQELYHRMRDEHRNGNVVIKSYVDMYATAYPSKLGNMGAGLGQWKTKQYKNVIADGTKFIGWNVEEQENEMIAPGCAAEKRIKLWQKYHKVLEEKGIRL